MIKGGKYKLGISDKGISIMQLFLIKGGKYEMEIHIKRGKHVVGISDQGISIIQQEYPFKGGKCEMEIPIKGSNHMLEQLVDMMQSNFYPGMLTCIWAFLLTLRDGGEGELFLRETILLDYLHFQVLPF